MNSEDVKEWLQIADEDLHSAKILNKEPVRKPVEVICYLCAQAVEKYLKAFLIYHDIIPHKTHNLSALNQRCIELDVNFNSIQALCGYLTTFANDIRYPHKYAVTDADANFAINAVEKIKNFKPVIDLLVEP
jgi:HEPN domain-containing protein